MAVPEPCILWPVAVSEPSPVLRVVTGGVGRDAVLDVAADDLVHFVHDNSWLDILLTALNDLPGGVTWTGQISDDHIVTLAASGTAEILWTHANTTLDPAMFGWTEADVGPATSFEAPNQAQGCWIPGLAGDPRGYYEDTLDEAVTAAVITRTLDGAVRGYDLSPEPSERLISFQRIHVERVLAARAVAGAPYSALETAWTVGGLAAGAAFRLCDDRTDRATYGTYSIARTTGRPWKLEPISNVRRYEIELPLVEVV